MQPPRFHFLPIVLLAVLLAGLSFVAGYLLFMPPDEPAPAAMTPSATTLTQAALTLPPPASNVSPEPPPLVITKALYGDLPDGTSADVTFKVAELIKGNALILTADNDLFGDPAPGIVKKLRVDYTVGGLPETKTVDENSILKIGTRTRSARLTIVKAIYGDIPNGPVIDVTDIVTGHIDNNALSITADNGLFGDPAFGIEKKLRVVYRLDDTQETRTVNENETLIISNLGF